MSEIVAERTTFDGRIVLLWSDGVITDRLGRHMPGCRVPRPRLFLVADEICLYARDELPRLCAAAKRAASPDDLRRRAEPYPDSSETAAEYGRRTEARLALPQGRRRVWYDASAGVIRRED